MSSSYDDNYTTFIILDTSFDPPNWLIFIQNIIQLIFVKFSTKNKWNNFYLNLILLQFFIKFELNFLLKTETNYCWPKSTLFDFHPTPWSKEKLISFDENQTKSM